jgi:trehalose/maltose hydrolase-like predicted phosphorylase
MLDIVYQNGSSPDFSEASGFNVTSNSSTVAQGYKFILSDFVAITKYVGVASTDAFTDPLSEAQNSSSLALNEGFDSLVTEHREAWESLWSSADIEVPGNEEIQLSARSALFHLWSNIRSGYEQPGIGDTAIAPAGLTSDSYAGLVLLWNIMLTVDILGCRYVHVTWPFGVDAGLCSLNRELSSEESRSCDAECEAI